MVAKAAYDHADEIGEAFAWFFKVIAVICGALLSVVFAGLPIVLILYLLTKLSGLSLDFGQIVTFGTLLLVGSIIALAFILYEGVSETEEDSPRIVAAFGGLLTLAALGLLIGTILLIATFGFHAEFPGQFLRWLGDA
jgi:hypothetical protein